MSDVVILGHSFVVRLKDSLTRDWFNLGLDLSHLRIHCLGKRGGRIPHIIAQELSSKIKEIRPLVVLLQIGGNDLDCDNFDSFFPRLASKVHSVAQWLVEGHGVRQVCIMQLLHREKTRKVNVQRYNSAVDKINVQLKELCADTNNTFYWRHKGLKGALTESLHRDGVHLNRAGMRKYIYSVRGAALHNSRVRYSSRTTVLCCCVGYSSVTAVTYCHVGYFREMTIMCRVRYSSRMTILCCCCWVF